MTKPQVTSDAHQDRSAAVSAAVTEIATKLAADEANLRKNSEQLKRAAEHETAAVHARAAAKRKQLHAALLHDVRSSLAPLIAAFCQEPSRTAATKFADALSHLAARGERELGAEFDMRMIALLFAERTCESNPNAVNSFANDTWISSEPGQSVLLECEGLRKVLAHGPLVEKALLSIESAVLDVANRAIYSPIASNVGRFAVKLAHLLHADRVAAVGAYDAEQRALEAQARPMPSFVAAG